MVEQGCIQLLLTLVCLPPSLPPTHAFIHLGRVIFPARYINHHNRQTDAKVLQHAVVQVCRDTVPAFRSLLLFVSPPPSAPLLLPPVFPRYTPCRL